MKSGRRVNVLVDSLPFLISRVTGSDRILRRVMDGVLKWSAHHSWRLGMTEIVLRRWQDGPGIRYWAPTDMC